MNSSTLPYVEMLGSPLNFSTPWYYTSEPSILPGLPDKVLTLISPVVTYWIFSLFFHLLDTRSHVPPFSWMNVERYRIHESEEVKKRNTVSPEEVFRTVVLQQVIQTALGLWWLDEDDPAKLASQPMAEHLRGMAQLAPWVSKAGSILLGDVTAARLLSTYGPTILYATYWWIIPSLQFLLAFFVLDTWQYFLHRFMHVNKFLYKHLHSVHHRLYVPYAYGALYNHPIEGFLLDSLGSVIAESIAQLSVRQSGLLFGFSAAKTVDDHCGFSLPWDPLQFMYKNNARYHDIHHQNFGLKFNFSQPFWIHWDIVLGTRWDKPNRPLAAEKREAAAAEAEVARQQKEAESQEPEIDGAVPTDNSPEGVRRRAQDLKRAPSHDSERSSDSGIAMNNTKEE